MPSTITIDATGRLVVPLPVRRRLRLVAGSRLRITEGPGSILLEPEYDEARIEEKDGILVVGGRLEGHLPDHRDVRQDRLDSLARP
jgi:AbrB family looped-hinge helix DNA binding protein